VFTSSIVVLMMALDTSETSVSFYQTTRRNIPEHSNLQLEIVLA
jgi:hypothetical protein